MRAFNVAALLLLLAGAARQPAAAAENPHAFMNDPARCTECHQTAPVRGVDDYTTVTFVDTIVNLCARCHEGTHLREEHPVEIRPEFDVPDDLHLDSYYTVTCTTCHDAHGPHEADRPFATPGFAEWLRWCLRRPETFRTFFLRRSNEKGELCLACHTGGVGAIDKTRLEESFFEAYVGSDRCRECHGEVWSEWKKTLHSRNFKSAGEDPGALRGDFSQVTSFAAEDVAFTVGEHWNQRYIVSGKRGLMVRPETWSLMEKKWIRSGSFSRPWLKYCTGCHTTALNPFNGKYLERGTGCEACHGPGRLHTESTDQFDIVNPAALVEERRDMICEACHTSGHDRSGQFRYPVGFRPGDDLMKFYRGLVPKAGQDTENFTGDGSYADRHRQFLFWVSRYDVLVGLGCDICTTHSRPPEGAAKEYRLTPDELCGTCHREQIEDFAGHAEHEPGQAGCLDCHPPATARTGDRYSIHDHKFQFGEPAFILPAGADPCLRCHPGEDAASL